MPIEGGSDIWQHAKTSEMKLPTRDITIDNDAAREVGVQFHSQKERLRLAKYVLLGLAVLTVLACIARIFAPEEAAEPIFELAKTTIPPLVTLVIGAYFNKNND